ncbi:MAG: hypothetical protein EZS28_040619, partial [Streblomastix strix]
SDQHIIASNTEPSSVYVLSVYGPTSQLAHNVEYVTTRTIAKLILQVEKFGFFRFEDFRKAQLKYIFRLITMLLHILLVVCCTLSSNFYKNNFDSKKDITSSQINATSTQNSVSSSQLDNSFGQSQSNKSNSDITFYIKNEVIENPSCSQSSPCKTINHILSFSPPSGFNKGVDNVIINLQSNTYDQDSIKLNSGTILSNILTVQSNGYTPSSSSSTKQSIITSSNSQSLFSIANNGHLKLYGLHFDNLLSDSTNPLIYLISQSSDLVNPQVIIRDCAFEQSAPITYQVTHPLIRIQGGKLTIENTLIRNYEFKNGGKVIQLDSQTEKQYLIDVINTEFRNIAQDVGSVQGGAVISGNIDSINPLRIRDKTLFNNITSTGQGGCIYLSGWEGTIELSKVTFIQCKGMNGGSIYLYLEGGSSITIEECEFKGCESIGNNKDYGGAIFM